ncbi:hypothetical protein GCM10022222_21180 [Amycolatopsis ultiminotia]|uniref:Uncharacterized protein n=1 Tax=Amycolatopsis ultiminotia TaxID=543629 RepID=A0ABP6VKW0_9PSEU
MNPISDELFGEVTPAVRRRGQQRAHAVLAAVLDRANDADLPPVTWTLTTRGSAVADVDTDGLSREEIRARFADWKRFLDLAELPFPGEALTMRAVGVVPGQAGDALLVALTAWLDDAEHDGAAGFDPAVEEC